MQRFVRTLTPPAYAVFSARHHIFTLLVLPRNDLKLDASVPHPMISVDTQYKIKQLYDAVETLCVLQKY